MSHCMFIEKIMEIRRLVKEDLEVRVSLLNNREISQYLDVDETFSLEKTKKWFDKISDNLLRTDYSFVLDGVVVGMGGVVGISPKDRHGELYIYLDPCYQGRGLGKKALNLMLHRAFIDNPSIEKIFLFTFASNERANSLYKSCGFTQEGALKKHTWHDGRLQDRLIFSIFRQDLSL